MRQQFHQNVADLRNALRQAGIVFSDNPSHITPIPVSGAVHCREVARRLLQEQGIYAQPINYPTVPKGEECLRIIITTRHLPKHIQYLAHSLNKILYGKDPSDRTQLSAVVAAAGAGA